MIGQEIASPAQTVPDGVSNLRILSLCSGLCGGLVHLLCLQAVQHFPPPFRRRFPALPCGVIAGYPMQTVMRFSRYTEQNGNKKVATKQTGHAFDFSEGLASRLCSELKSQKGELPSPAGTERISKICKY